MRVRSGDGMLGHLLVRQRKRGISANPPCGIPALARRRRGDSPPPRTPPMEDDRSMNRSTTEAAEAFAGAGYPESGRSIVVGAGGQIGGCLIELLPRETTVGTWVTVPVQDAVYFQLADVTADASAVSTLFERVRPDVIYVTAGMTNAEACEANPDRAMLLNCHAPAEMASLANERGIRTVWYSSEYVFGATGGPHTEASDPDPLSVYGRSKLAGESAIRSASSDALIIRTTTVYGPELHGKNFAYRLAAALREETRIDVPSDQVSTPSYNRDLAAATINLVAAGMSGVVHLAGNERMSRVDLARRLAGAAGLDSSSIVATPTRHLSQRAPRPLEAGLASNRCDPSVFRDVEAAVADWLQRPRGKPWP